MSTWEVPGAVAGYQLQELLGFGAGGEVWQAREGSSGELVVLRRLPGGDRAGLAKVRSDAKAVRALASPHVVGLRSTLRVAGDDVLVLDHAAGGSLAALLARRGRVGPGEVVTALAPVAMVLGQAHDQSLVHGRIRASSVLLTAEGKPLLDGLGQSCLSDEGQVLDPDGAADVWALGALAHLMLTAEQPGDVSLADLAPTTPLPLVTAVESALAFDPTARPSAAELGAALLAACPALPLQGILRSTASVERAPLPARRPWSRLLTGAGAALAVTSVVAVGWVWGRHGTEQSRTVPLSASTPTAGASVPARGTDWGRVLGQLDRLRERAFATADLAALSRVYAPGSEMLLADRQALAELTRSRRTAVGLAHDVRVVTPITVGGDRVELRVEESLAAYVVRGVLTTHHAEGPLLEHVVVLVRTPAGWRVAEVRGAEVTAG